LQISSLSLYNPNSLTEQELVERFVIRKKEFKKIYKDIKNSDMKYPEQHYIIEAQRGYGKTTLLKRLYIEIKRDKELKARIKEHKAGRVNSTKNRLPIELVYYEACLNSKDTTKREKYLKTSWGKRYIKNRLGNYLTG